MAELVARMLPGFPGLAGNVVKPQNQFFGLSRHSQHRASTDAKIINQEGEENARNQLVVTLLDTGPDRDKHLSFFFRAFHNLTTRPFLTSLSENVSV